MGLGTCTSGVQGMAALSPIHCCNVGSATFGLPCCGRRETARVNTRRLTITAVGSAVTPPPPPTFGAILLTISEMSTAPAACFFPRFPDDHTKEPDKHVRVDVRHYGMSLEISGVCSSPSLRGEGEVESQMMSCWKSESLCGDSPLKAALDFGILVGVLNSGGQNKIFDTTLTTLVHRWINKDFGGILSPPNPHGTFCALSPFY